jgi:hypothetical protein
VVIPRAPGPACHHCGPACHHTAHGQSTLDRDRTRTGLVTSAARLVTRQPGPPRDNGTAGAERARHPAHIAAKTGGPRAADPARHRNNTEHKRNAEEKCAKNADQTAALLRSTTLTPRAATPTPWRRHVEPTGDTRTSTRRGTNQQNTARGANRNKSPTYSRIRAGRADARAGRADARAGRSGASGPRSRDARGTGARPLNSVPVPLAHRRTRALSRSRP